MWGLFAIRKGCNVCKLCSNENFFNCFVLDIIKISTIREKKLCLFELEWNKI